MWAGSDVCGLLAANVGPFAHNVGLTHGSFAANVGRVEQRLWVSRIPFVGRYTYAAIGKEDDATHKFARAKSEANLAKRLHQYDTAHHACEQAMALYDHLAMLLHLLR